MFDFDSLSFSSSILISRGDVGEWRLVVPISHGCAEKMGTIYIHTYIYINTKDTEYGDVSGRFWILIGKDHLILELQSL